MHWHVWEGLYSHPAAHRTQYSCDDGSYKDVTSARPAGSLCDIERLFPCQSCETNLDYLAGTGEAEVEGAPRPAIALRLDDGFRLSGRCWWSYSPIKYLADN